MGSQAECRQEGLHRKGEKGTGGVRGRNRVWINENIVSMVRRQPLLFRLSFLAYLWFGHSMTPPPLLNFVGYPEFKKIGSKYLEYIIEFTGLRPDDHVLDVGCGIGRTAIPMTEYLNTQGGYEGFDVIDMGIKWCSRKITSRYPNFRFQQAGVYNSHYSPQGAVDASIYRFPFPGNTFDVAYATSVFTHMMPDAVTRYLAEMSRVLKPGGRSLCTFFIVDDESAARMAGSRFPFCMSPDREYGVMEEHDPESAIAYRLEYVRSSHEDAGLSIMEPIRFGSWSGRKNPMVGGQDIVVGSK